MFKCITNRSGSKKETSIEKEMEAWLVENKIPFEKQKILIGRSQVEFFVPPRTVIFCDGDYWHHRPGIPERDKRITDELKAVGYEVRRFWEKAIHAGKRPVELLKI